MKIFVLKLFNQYDVNHKFSYYLINAESKDDAVKIYNEKYNSNIRSNSLNSDDIFEVDFNNSDILNITSHMKFIGE